MKLYRIFMDRREEGASAPPDVEWHRVPRRGVVSSWEPLTLTLSGGELRDYLLNDVGWRLCSPALRDAVEAARHESDAIQWLPVFVDDGRMKHPYFVLHFPVTFDLLSREQSVFDKSGGLIKAVYDEDAIGEHRVFPQPDAVVLSFVVAEPVHFQLRRAALTGLTFEPVPIAKRGEGQSR